MGEEWVCAPTQVDPGAFATQLYVEMPSCMVRLLFQMPFVCGSLETEITVWDMHLRNVE